MVGGTNSRGFGASRMIRWTEVDATRWPWKRDAPADAALLAAAGYVAEASLEVVRCVCGRPAAAWSTDADGSRMPVCAAIVTGHVDPPGPSLPLDPGSVVPCECRCRECRYVPPGHGVWVRPLRLGDAVLIPGYIACPPCAEAADGDQGWTSHHGPGRGSGSHGPVRHIDRYGREAIVGTLSTGYGGQAEIDLSEWLEVAQAVPQMLGWMRGPHTRQIHPQPGPWWVREVEWYGAETLVECECQCGCRRYGTIGAMLRDDAFQCETCAVAGHERRHRSSPASGSPPGA
jgi:hypothetical protein